MVFCTEFEVGWWSWELLRRSCVRCGWCRVTHIPWHHPHHTHNLRSSSQDHHPTSNSVQKTISRNSTSSAPDDGRMYPKHVPLRIHQWNYLAASSWHFTLFHEEVAWSTNPQVFINLLLFNKFGKGHTTCQMFTENGFFVYRQIAGTSIIVKCVNQYRTLHAEILTWPELLTLVWLLHCYIFKIHTLA